MKSKAIRLGAASALAALSLAAFAAPGHASVPQGQVTPSVAKKAPALRPLAAPKTVHVVGTFEVGQAVHHSEAPWTTPDTKLTFQWMRDGIAIPGANGFWYDIRKVDVGKKLSFRVTGSAPGYTKVTRTSTSSIPVMSSTPSPSIEAGPRTPGSVLNAQLAAPWATTTPVTMKFQWLRDGVPIPGATALRYKITGQDLNKSLVLRTQGITPDKKVTTVFSAPIRPSLLQPLEVEGGPESVIVDGITVRGASAQAGRTVRVRPFMWFPTGVKTTYQWLSNGAPIAGATGAAYTYALTDYGKKISVAVTGTRAGSAVTTIESGGYRLAGSVFRELGGPMKRF